VAVSRLTGAIGAALAALLTIPPAAAQTQVEAEVSASTDERRRGLSWSDGRAAASARVAVRGAAGWSLDARVTSTREAPRHGGADAVVDLDAGYGVLSGGLRLEGYVVGHLFAGAAGSLDYVEGGASAAYLLGPAELEIAASYAPVQSAIGGDNLYLSTRFRFGVPATPYTLVAGAGRSSGSVDDPARAARLRPAGDVTDWVVGVERSSGPVTLALSYVGTDVRRERELVPGASQDSGDRFLGRVSVGF
jgi:uncharacterized protein (TIGR02001 family)